METLGPWLIEHLPESPPPTVIHNDYKLNNVLLALDDPRRMTAVLDWEMATVGDPLSDVASLLVYWTEPGEEDLLGGLKSVTSDPTFRGGVVAGCMPLERPRSVRSTGIWRSPTSNWR
jgi:aminoglycoside phosphotransferase (APT) family kinase protein